MSKIEGSKELKTKKLWIIKIRRPPIQGHSHRDLDPLTPGLVGIPTCWNIDLSELRLVGILCKVKNIFLQNNYVRHT